MTRVIRSLYGMGCRVLMGLHSVSLDTDGGKFRDRSLIPKRAGYSIKLLLFVS